MQTDLLNMASGAWTTLESSCPTQTGLYGRKRTPRGVCRQVGVDLGGIGGLGERGEGNQNTLYDFLK